MQLTAAAADSNAGLCCGLWQQGAPAELWLDFGAQHQQVLLRLQLEQDGCQPCSCDPAVAVSWLLSEATSCCCV